MQATVVKTRAGRLTIRALRNGDTTPIRVVFDGLSAESRRLRFGIAKQDLSPAELEILSRADADHHVLVGTIDGIHVGIARLARDADERTLADVAVAVLDAYQARGVGTALLRALVADAAAAGITHVRADVRLENRASLCLLSKTTRVVAHRIAGGEVALVALTT
jgi:ribosomal protein S18 acetylase RimI-like enzyme